MFSNPFPNAFGLDIGDLSIKAVQLRKCGLNHKLPRYELVTCRSINLPPGLIVNGELEKPEEVRKYIQKLIRGISKQQKPIWSPWVVAALPETKSFIKLIQIKKTTEELIDEDIINTAKKHIPFDEDNYYLQWQIIKPSCPTCKTGILIGAAPKLMSDSYTYLLESLGLGVVALETEALSLARSMVTASKEYNNEARAILDIGATGASLIVFDNDVVQFSTSLPFSGEILTTAITQKLGMPYEDAEEAKKHGGLDYKKTENKVWPIIVEQTNGLVNSIREAFNFYYSHFPETNKVTRVIMCGGGANLERLDRIISAQLKIIARPGLPWKNLSAKRDIPISKEASLSYATAIGLALRAADNPFFTTHIV